MSWFSGKTSVVKRFGIEFESFAKENYPVLKVKYRHINCRRNRTVYSVLVHLLQSLIPYFPNRGFSPADLLRILESHLRDTNSYLLLALDEIDVLARQDPEFFSFMYSLTRLNDELLVPEDDANQRISLILISFLAFRSPSNDLILSALFCSSSSIREFAWNTGTDTGIRI